VKSQNCAAEQRPSCFRAPIDKILSGKRGSETARVRALQRRPRLRHFFEMAGHQSNRT
jgi:hypothetical protein